VMMIMMMAVTSADARDEDYKYHSLTRYLLQRTVMMMTKQ